MSAISAQGCEWCQHATVALEYFITCRCGDKPLHVETDHGVEIQPPGPPHHQSLCPLRGCEDYDCPAALTEIDQIGEYHSEACPLYRKNPDRWGEEESI